MRAVPLFGNSRPKECTSNGQYPFKIKQPHSSTSSYGPSEYLVNPQLRLSDTNNPM